MLGSSVVNFGGEDFEVNQPVQYYIFSIFVVWSTFQPISCKRELKHIHTLINVYV
jgi:hypothetical protein